ncbi:MAG TPA: hypothetical protein VFE96_03105 [Candidatus Bathyarchaeia archaeon]|jgi:hypothetical protein|nr:hypothetical protein [Candidatus Bathyarchaeia archaeon]
MVVEADYYRVRLRFKRLFADPAIFEDQENAVRRYLFYSGPPSDQTLIYQITDIISPTNGAGKTPDIAGTARYVHERRVVRSEYFENVAVVLEYADFGSGLSPDDHQRLWKRQTWGRMNFLLEEFNHDRFKIEIPSIPELYHMINTRADPTALVDVELPELPDKLFRTAIGFLNAELRQLAEKHHQTIDLYVARDLLPEEKQTLEKRLTRPSTQSTVYVLLSRSHEHPVL